MNLFTTFTFGRLIKTFIPGVIWAVVAVFVYDIYAIIFGYARVYEFFSEQGAALLIFYGIVFAIALGLFSNTLVFAIVLNRFVRDPVRQPAKNAKKAPEYEKLERLREQLHEVVKRKYWEKMSCSQLQDCSRLDGKDGGNCTNPNCEGRDGINGDLREAFFMATDPEYLMLDRFDASKIMFVQEQYWYYMELHINVALSIVFLLFFHFVWFIVTSGGADALPLLFPYGLGVGIVIFFVSMARKNYVRHTGKMISLMCSYFSEGSLNSKNGVPGGGQTTSN
ncbi:hypothetical protein [uncultured Rhodospira sp.]|uniref:hypothetical protein n=1 Tax=uncultured Rhodospira sp. TaxID=1936189 RepID=UPI00262E965A|nr:hypothetical protein [uncultured Rhodospira sp.]